MPQSVTTYADEWAVVSAAPEHFTTVAEALAASPPGMRVHVHASYEAEQGEIHLTDRRHLSADHGTKLPPVVVETTHKRPPGPRLSGFETPSLTIRGAKWTSVTDVHTSPGGAGIVFEDTSEMHPNSCTLTRCTIDRPAKTGVSLSANAHAAHLRDVSIVHAGEYGMFANGPANVVLDGVRVEDCGEAGIKARRCEGFVLERSYIEANARDPSDANADVTLSDCPSLTVARNYCNGLGVAAHAISVYGGASTGEVGPNECRGYPGEVVLNNVGDSVRVR